VPAEHGVTDIPIRHDSGNGERSGLMYKYQSGGTPRAEIIDKSGRVRWNGFRLDSEQAVSLIDRHRGE